MTKGIGLIPELNDAQHFGTVHETTIMEFAAHQTCPYIPDDVTIPQFMFDSQHETRPNRKAGTPWLVEDATGKKLMESDVRGAVSSLEFESWACLPEETNDDHTSSFASGFMDSQMD